MSLPDKTNGKPEVEFVDVSISFDDKPVLDGINLKLGAGETVVITGLSGCGKSVLLRLAIGLLRPDKGQIFIRGREIGVLGETELLELRSEAMGMVFQEDTLFTGMTVEENTAYRLTEHGWPREETDRAVLEILTFVGLENDTDKIPEELSIGMRRRLELARALVGWPSIMLFDEPTSGLDPINSRHVLDLIIRARDIHGISSLHVTKELHEIPYLASHRAAPDANGAVQTIKARESSLPRVRVIVIDQGKIVFGGTPAEFDKCSIPVIQQIKAPESTMRMGESFDRDPWAELRRRRPS